MISRDGDPSRNRIVADACPIVEVDHGPPWRRGRGQTRVRSFAVLPPSGQELRAVWNRYGGARRRSWSGADAPSTGK
jgi:hypothetical protein